MTNTVNDSLFGVFPAFGTTDPFAVMWRQGPSGTRTGTVLAHEFNSTGSAWPYAIGTLGTAVVLWPTGDSGADELWIME